MKKRYRLVKKEIIEGVFDFNKKIGKRKESYYEEYANYDKYNPFTDLKEVGQNLLSSHKNAEYDEYRFVEEFYGIKKTGEKVYIEELDDNDNVIETYKLDTWY